MTSIEAYVGQVMLFAGDFVPAGWLPCDGQVMPIEGNQLLYSVIGSYYGGDGISSFALPDLRGRAPVHNGSGGPGVRTLQTGEKAGYDSATLTDLNLPSFEVNQPYSTTGGTATTMDSDMVQAVAVSSRGQDINQFAPVNKATGTVPLSFTGANHPVATQSPILAMTYCICSTGVYPARG